MAITLYQPALFGDTSGKHARPAAQTISVDTNSGERTLVGDVPTLMGRAVGGNDTLGCGGLASGIVIGDAITITGRARGGNDDISASSKAYAIAVGDAVTLGGQARGGNDIVTASTYLHGGIAYGDSEIMANKARGGHDVLKVGLAGTAYGDAQTLSGSAIGGNDTFIGSNGIPGETARMYGDGEQLLERSKGGNDVLISGPETTDHMWGDAAVIASTAKTGADIFVFSPHNGQDTIFDFQPAKDRIELKGFGLTTFDDVASHIQYTLDGALIGLTTSWYGQDTILVVGVTQLSASDFIY